MAWPNTLDNLPTNYTDGTLSATAHALAHNQANAAINALEAELGLNPRGASASVAVRLTSMTAATTTAQATADGAIPKSLVTTLGDQIVGTGAGTVGRVARGNPGDVWVTQAAGTLAWTNSLIAVARHGVQIGGTLIGERRAFNLIAGAGVSFQASDDPSNERVNITVTATGGGAAPGAPTISTFSPLSAVAGATVVIVGTNLAGATSVKFNGVSATFVVDSSTQITATVPGGATSGPISVTVGGTTVVSADTFTVGISYTQALFNTNPGGTWLFDELTGTTAFDSGTGSVPGTRNGTYTGGYTLGATPLTADSIASVLLDGTSGYVTLGANGVWLNAGDWTLMCLYKPTSIKTTGDGTVCFMGPDTTASAHIITLSNGKMAGAIANVAAVSATGATTLVAGNVYLLEWSYNSTTRTLSYYINGVFDGSGTYTAGNVAALGSAYDNLLGAYNNPKIDFVPGRVDSMSWHNRVLTTAERASLAAAIPTAPPPTGGILKRVDFETGDFSQAWLSNIQCANFNFASTPEFTRGNVFIDTAVHGSGGYSMRVDLPPAANKSACEVPMDSSLRHIALGAIEYFAWETLFPTWWVAPDGGPGNGGWGATICQYGQYPQNVGSCWQFVADADEMWVAIQTGQCAFGTGCPPPGTNIKPSILTAGNLTLGVWHQFAVRVKWDVSTNGTFDVWTRERGVSTWDHPIALTGIPTLQYNSESAPAPVLDMYEKLGFYRGPSSTPLSVWHDTWVRGTSESAVKAALA